MLSVYKAKAFVRFARKLALRTPIFGRQHSGGRMMLWSTPISVEV